MNFFKLCIFAIVIFLLPYGLCAQTYSSGHESVKSEINFEELANYYEKHPEPLVRKLPFDEDEEGDFGNNPEPDPSKVHTIHRSAGRPNDQAPSFLSASLAPADTFLSTLSNGSNIPPDTHGDVDLTYCVTAINPYVHIQRRNGTNATAILSLNYFWRTILPAGTDAFDPRVHYDPHYKRWIIVTDAVDQSTMTNSTILIAVSSTCDPKGSWHMYAIPIDPTGNAWLDYPNVGFNTKWITVTGNMFRNHAGGATGGVIYVFDYASIMAGTGAPFVKISQSSSFTLCPAITYDTTQQSMFLTEIYNRSSGKLQLWKITGPVASPVLASVGYPTSAQHWKGSGAGGNDFSPQVGTLNKTDAGDDRIHRMVYRNNKLWCAHSIFLPATGTVTRCSVMWWEIDTLANPIQNGMIDDAATPTFFDYPSIAVNANDDALIGFGYHSKFIHPSCAYAYRLSTDPPDSLHQPYIYRHGQATYYQTFGGGKDRWGDYSAATVDPRNDLDFWTIQESVPATPVNYWDTWWAHIKLYPNNPRLTAKYDTVVVNASDTLKFSDPTKLQCGANIIWGYDGGTYLSGTGADPQGVKWATTGLKVVSFKDSILGSVITYYDTVLVRNANSVSLLNHNNDNVQIIPNPNNGAFDVLFTGPVVSQKVILNLMNMQGRSVFYRQFDISNNGISVETNNLPPGVYLARMDVDGKVITQKITINR